jgi:hypothetical protein
MAKYTVTYMTKAGLTLERELMVQSVDESDLKYCEGDIRQFVQDEVRRFGICGYWRENEWFAPVPVSSAVVESADGPPDAKV